MAGQKTVQLRVSPRELQLLRESVEEMLNDSDLIWGGPDDHRRLYEEFSSLHDRLHKLEQTEVFTH